MHWYRHNWAFLAHLINKNENSRTLSMTHFIIFNERKYTGISKFDSILVHCSYQSRQSDVGDVFHRKYPPFAVWTILIGFAWVSLVMTMNFCDGRRLVWAPYRRFHQHHLYGQIGQEACSERVGFENRLHFCRIPNAFQTTMQRNSVRGSGRLEISFYSKKLFTKMFNLKLFYNFVNPIHFLVNID